MNQPYESILPSYVMDVYSYGSINDFPTIGDPGMLYIDISKRAVYRYNGEEYVMLKYFDDNDYLKDETKSNNKFDECKGCGSRSFIMINDHMYQCEYCGNKYFI